MDAAQTISYFTGKRILVIGDIMLDSYVFGNVTRISPEAPIPIVLATRNDSIIGGAANVAHNIVALGGKATLIGVVGNDLTGKKVTELIRKAGIDSSGIVVQDDKMTIEKTRIIGNKQQLVRIDHEDTLPLDDTSKSAIKQFIGKTLSSYDAVIISDYNKGVAEEGFTQELIQLARDLKKPIIVDPKPVHAHLFKGVTVITPNHKEASEIAHLPETNGHEILAIGRKIMHELGCKVVITRGEKGMTIFDGVSEKDIPTKARQVFDVTGAGDTVTAVLALALAAGSALADAADLANHAAGIVVEKIGNGTVTQEQLRGSFR